MAAIFKKSVTSYAEKSQARGNESRKKDVENGKQARRVYKKRHLERNNIAPLPHPWSFYVDKGWSVCGQVIRRPG